MTTTPNGTPTYVVEIERTTTPTLFGWLMLAAFFCLVLAAGMAVGYALFPAVDPYTIPAEQPVAVSPLSEAGR